MSYEKLSGDTPHSHHHLYKHNTHQRRHIASDGRYIVFRVKGIQHLFFTIQSSVMYSPKQGKTHSWNISVHFIEQYVHQSLSRPTYLRQVVPVRARSSPGLRNRASQVWLQRNLCRVYFPIIMCSVYLYRIMDHKSKHTLLHNWEHLVTYQGTNVRLTSKQKICIVTAAYTKNFCNNVPVLLYWPTWHEKTKLAECIVGYTEYISSTDQHVKTFVMYTILYAILDETRAYSISFANIWTRLTMT